MKKYLLGLLIILAIGLMASVFVSIVKSQGGGGCGTDFCDSDITTTGTPNQPGQPTISITSPKDGDRVSGTVTISGTAENYSSDDSVKVFIDQSNTSLSVNDSDLSNWSSSWNTATYTNSQHQITAKLVDRHSNVKASSTITVTVNNQGTLTCSPSSTTLTYKGDLRQLKATYVQGANSIDVTKNASTTWESSDPDCVFVWNIGDYKGSVIPGMAINDSNFVRCSANVKATYKNTSGICEVNVEPPIYPFITISSPSDGQTVRGIISSISGGAGHYADDDAVNVSAGSTFSDSGIGIASDGSWKTHSAKKWNTLSENDGPAKIIAKLVNTASGEVKASTTISVNIQNNYCEITQPANDNTVVSGTIPVSVVAHKNNTSSLALTLYVDGNTSLLNPLISQKSVTSTSQTFSTQFNTTKVSNGDHTIQGKLEDQDYNPVATCSRIINVQNDIPYLSCSPSSMSLLPGESKQASATYHQGTQSQDVTNNASWSSSDGSCASVNGSGLVTATSSASLLQCSTNITASYSNLSCSIPVTVSSSTNRYSCDTGTYTCYVSSTGAYSNEPSCQNACKPSGGYNCETSGCVYNASGGTYSSTSSCEAACHHLECRNYACVSVSGAGNDTCSTTAQCNPLTGVSVSLSPSTISVGGTATAEAYAHYLNGSSTNVTNQVTNQGGWTMSSRTHGKQWNEIISVHYSAVVITGLSPGVVTISATFQGQTGSADLTVNCPPGQYLATTKCDRIYCTSTPSYCTTTPACSKNSDCYKRGEREIH